MKIVASVGVLVALVVVGCGGGAPPGDGRTLEERAKAAATAAQRQRVLDACKPHLTRAFCGVAIPRNGNDKTPQRWWNAAGCLADHPNKFSAQCKSLFNSTCSDSGDDCICDPGYVLNERDRCVQPGECDSDNECPAVANGKSRCTSHEESDPPTGHCVVTCKAGFVLTNGACVPPPPPNKVVFVTSQIYTAALGGLAGADAKCQSLATGAGLTGTYKAWLSSSSVDARDRLTHSAIPYVLSDRTTVVADNWSDLVDGSLKHAIDKTETGAAGPS